jgi:hypothetical protein
MTTTRSLLPALLAFPLAACAEPDGDPEASFRNHVDGVQDMLIYNGPSTDDDDCLIWDIQGSGAHDGPALPDDSNLLVEVIGDDFVLPDDTVVCHREGNELESTQRVVGGQNQVLFTVWKRYVFEGDVPAEEQGGSVVKNFADQLLYTFKGDQAFAGSAKDDVVLVTATDTLQHTSQVHKLLVAALISAECGGNGLPGH